MKIFLLFLIVVYSCVLPTANSQIVLESTRVVIEDGATNGSVVVRNVVNNPFVVQAWLTDKDGNNVKGFAVQPNFFVAFPDRKQYIRVVYQGAGAVEDKETVVYLNILSSALNKKTDDLKNQISAAVNQTIKIFYRPSGLNGEDAKASLGKLEWQVSEISKGVFKYTVTNPTKYNVWFSNPFIMVRKPDDEYGFVNFFPNKIPLLTENKAIDIAPGKTVSFNFEPTPSISFDPGLVYEFWLKSKDDFGGLAIFAAPLNSDGTLSEFYERLPAVVGGNTGIESRESPAQPESPPATEPAQVPIPSITKPMTPVEVGYFN